ncbi:MAG: TlpA disulfide reductase family protein [Saprospiraceae bacterium]
MKYYLILFLLCTYINNSISQIETKTGKGDTAYNIVGIDQSGNDISISAFKGKYILLNFTATYCKPCWSTYEHLDDIQEKYIKKLKIISFHIDDERADWERIAKKLNIEYNCSSIWDGVNKPDILDKYKIDGFPYFFLIDRNGIIIKKWFGNRTTKLDRFFKRFCK